MNLLLPYLIVLLAVFALLRNRSHRNYQEKQESFWEKEQRANLTRKQDISNLDYIEIPLDTFPCGRYKDPQLEALETELTRLGSRKILNLSGISNTDLKLKYGAANLTALSEYDMNFTSLARTIAAYGKRLAELGHTPEAIAVLEFGVSCRTDVSTNYTLLGSLYYENGHPEKAQQLAGTVQDMDLLLKDSILQQLAESGINCPQDAAHR